MKFSGAFAPNVRSDQEMIVFCFDDDRRVLVRCPLTLKDAEVLAEEEFGLNGLVWFETNELAECGPVNVRIREDTWVEASKLSAQVYVRASCPIKEQPIAAPPREQEPIVAMSGFESVLPLVGEVQESVRFKTDKTKNDHQDPTTATTDVKVNPGKLLTPASSASSIDPNEPASVMRPVHRPKNSTKVTKAKTTPRVQLRKPISVAVKHEESDDSDEDVPMLSAVEWSDDEAAVSIKEEPQDDNQHWLANDGTTVGIKTEEEAQLSLNATIPDKNNQLTDTVFLSPASQGKLSPRARSKTSKTGNPKPLSKSSRKGLSSFDLNQPPPANIVPHEGSVQTFK
ncbi:hypothetical protein BXZ70DRAFT_731503 [Cristinia sonorae]|uniref:Uncharacterized protein n=1 Tax=Cristinia sonorae TaxID=1940300 RepID=A0A8K0XS80_9AGAR|nr:hypothetical protein BXZ70DRAFT_731503 [Cristinia sonorae]